MSGRTEKHLLLLAICLAWIWLPGCGIFSPTTRLDVTGIGRYSSDKDFSFAVERMTICKLTGDVTIHNLELTNTGSTILAEQRGIVTVQAQAFAQFTQLMAAIAPTFRAPPAPAPSGAQAKPPD